MGKKETKELETAKTRDFIKLPEEKQAGNGRLSKIGEWLRSDSKPLMDLSGLGEREKAAMMKLILK